MRVCPSCAWVLLCGCLLMSPAVAGEKAVDLRAFDGRASTLLARLREAGTPVYRLVDVADLRVPQLTRDEPPNAVVEKLAAASGLRLDWIDGKPLLSGKAMPPAGEPPRGETPDDVWRLGWARDTWAVTPILDRAGRGDAQIRRACAEAILRFGRAAGVALLDRDKTIDLVRLALSDADWLLRRQAVLAAAELKLPDAAEIVAKAADDENPETRRAAAVAAGRLGGDKGAELLDKLAGDKDSRVRCAAAQGCADLGGARAVATLGKLIDEKDVSLSLCACRAAGQVGTPEALALLTKAAQSKDPRVLRGAAVGLGPCRADGAVAALKPLLSYSGSGYVRPNGAAAVSLGMQGGADAVRALLEQWEKNPRVEIVYGLGLAGGVDAKAALERIARHDVERFRRAAAFALGHAEPVAADPLQVEDLAVRVQAVRPRVFIRADDTGGRWTGPSVAKMRANFRRADYQRRERKDKLPGTPVGQAVLWLVSGDELAGADAAASLSEAVSEGTGRARGETPSYSGISVQRVAAMYDWLHEHGDVAPVHRRLVMHHLEDWGSDYHDEWLAKKRETVFYSRRWGCLAGCGAVGAALFGDSPLAARFLATTCFHLKSEDGLGTIRQAQDGGTAGNCYGLHHMFTDCANLVACVTSGTDWNAQAFIRDHRGDWLEKQLYFQMHFTYPDGTFFKDGDIWGGSADDHDQYRMQVDVVTALHKNGFGRAWADRMEKRWPNYFPSDYHTEFVWQFFVFNDPDVKPRPLTELPRAMLFSPDIDGYCLWRSSWDPDATVVHFHAGDSLDMHGGADQGKFVIWKHKPLAGKNGAYIEYGSPLHSYYRSARSANCVVFGSGGQPSYTARFGGVNSFAEFKKVRAASGKPVTGRVVAHEATDAYARAVANLDGTTPDGGVEHKWTREIVFLDYKFVLVLDRVRTTAKYPVKWLLNFEKEPQVEGALIRCDNPPGRLFCRTLLPDKPNSVKVGGKGAPEVMRHQWAVEFAGPDPAAKDQVFLNVLFATDTRTDQMPECSMKAVGKSIEVKVGGAAYTFGAEP